MPPRKDTRKDPDEVPCTERVLGIPETSDTCKAFAAVLCVAGVAAGCVTLVAIFKARDSPVYWRNSYRSDFAVRRELPANGLRMPGQTTPHAGMHGAHGPDAVEPDDDDNEGGGKWMGRERHGLFWGKAKGKGKGKGRGRGRGRGAFAGRRHGPDHPFGVRGPTGDFLWERGAGRRGHHVDSGIGPMRIIEEEYDEEDAMQKASRCLRSLEGRGQSAVLGEKGFIPSPDKWLEQHEDNVERALAATRRRPQPKQLFLGDSIVRRLGVGLSAMGGNGAGASLLTLGISGDTTTNLLWRLRHGELPRGLAPEKIVLLIGTNDLAHGRDRAVDAPLRAALATCAIVRHVRAQGLTAPIALTLILPRGKEWPHSHETNSTLRTNALLSALVRGAAPAVRIHAVDCSKRFENADGEILPHLMPDYTHPSPKGYIEWNACLAAAHPDPSLVTGGTLEMQAGAAVDVTAWRVPAQ